MRMRLMVARTQQSHCLTITEDVKETPKRQQFNDTSFFKGETNADSIYI
jgi:hypothetical protein